MKNIQLLKWFLPVLLFNLSGTSFAQTSLSGQQLLDKAISYHDPNGHWKNFKGELSIVMSTPNSDTRKTDLELNLQAQYFKAIVSKNDDTISYILDKGNCDLKYNNGNNISEALKDSLQITCERARKLKDYYTYLYGLPMKLKDPGTNIAPKVTSKTFKGKAYLVLKVNYDEKVGKDTWYFYFDPKTYKMEVYQFFHEESKNDGEYILLSDEISINEIKMPKVRAWYYNKDNTYLGTDNLEKVNPID